MCLNEKSESGLELICDFHIGDNQGGKKKVFNVKRNQKTNKAKGITWQESQILART